jgi:hypothetical protein
MKQIFQDYLLNDDAIQDSNNLMKFHKLKEELLHQDLNFLSANDFEFS